MYSVIERHHEVILNTITQEEVSEYDWLIEHRERAADVEYRSRYKRFWGMNVARLGSSFYEAYFETFENSLAEPVVLGKLCRMLYEAYVRHDGRQTLQFSFATKLMHMLNPRLPIYDSRVAWFFLFQEPSTDLTPEDRIEKFLAFHNFLESEYERVIRCGHLATAIAAFRGRFDPKQHTDEKIIDWLIWSLVNFAVNGGMMEGKIIYS